MKKKWPASELLVYYLIMDWKPNVFVEFDNLLKWLILYTCLFKRLHKDDNTQRTQYSYQYFTHFPIVSPNIVIPSCSL